MKRNPSELADREFDLLVVGAGIHGACIAREAALRGLSVGLIDRGDFGAGTSANSLKIIHGGLRYLQKLDIPRMRSSACERRVLMRIAPHLIRPLPCVLPTGGWGSRSRLSLGLGRWLCDRVAPDKADPGDALGRLPAGRIMTRAEVAGLFPGLGRLDYVTGGLLWHDCQVYNSERLTLAFVRSAVEQGAVAANHVEARRLIVEKRRVVGASAHDAIGGQDFDIRARVVVNAAGPWAQELVATADGGSLPRPLLLTKAWNVVTRAIHPTYTLGISAVRKAGARLKFGRMLVITPWRGHSIIGTGYTPAADGVRPEISDTEIEELLTGINEAYPTAQLTREDVDHCHVGLLPARSRDLAAKEDKLADRPVIVDHQRAGGLAGLITVVGVKYTTGRLVGEQVAESVCTALGKPAGPRLGRTVPVDGGDLANPDDLEASLRQAAPGPLLPAIGRLARHYGRRAAELVDHCRQHPHDAEPIAPGVELTVAEVRYGVREEMAVKLTDVVMDRTGLGALGLPGDPALDACARIMAAELAWSNQTLQDELRTARTMFRRLR